MPQIVIRTLNDFRDKSGLQIGVICSNCRHWQILDLDALIAKLGGDFDIYDRQGEFLRRLKCARCGANNPSIQITAANTPKT